MSPFPPGAPAAKILEEIRAGDRPTLGPGPAKAGPWRARLAGLADGELLDAPRLREPRAAACVRAGLLLLGGDLDGSHAICQAVDTREGSYWHAIVHRREGDYGNSKYWFRRVGDHPVFTELAAAAKAARGEGSEILSRGAWDPFHVVDLVEECRSGGRRDLREPLEELQEKEMLLLLAHCALAAVST